MQRARRPRRSRPGRRVAALLAVLTGLLVVAAGAPAQARPAVRPASGPAVLHAAGPVDRCTEPASARSGRPVLDTPKGTEADPIVVGVKPLDPFVTRSGSTCEGFSIELWDEVARRNGWTTVYLWEDTLPPLLEDVEKRRVDAAIAGISITREREEKVDFSYPMFNAGLQIMVSRDGGGVGTLAGELGGLLTASVGRFLLFLLVVIFLAGNVVWWTRRRHERSPQPYLLGVGDGMYRAAAIGLAGDIGTADPRRPVGRFVAVVWVVLGVCFVSLFTAAVTSRLTVSSIRSDIAGVSDLAGRTVVTVKGSTAEGYLRDRGLPVTTVPRIEDAYPLLLAHDADAVVFDAPVLQHFATTADGAVSLVGPVFKPEDYGIALPLTSPLRKQVNATLLDMRADGAYERIYTSWFGSPGS